MAEEQKQDSTPEQAAASAQPSLLDQLVETTKLQPGSEAFSITRQGLQAFITGLLEPQRAVQKVTPALVDDMIAALDQKLCKQVDAILHNPDFQKLESSWRSLKYLVDRTDFRENNKIQIVSVSKETLLADFEDAPEVMKSGLYKTVYSAEYGQFGGQPFAAIVANYEFGPGTQDIALLEKCASVSAMAHAPFIAAAGPEFFGIENFSQLPNLKDLSAVFEMPQFTKWNAFRESEDARYVGLAVPHFLLRVPYGTATVPAKKFLYNEEAKANNQFCWGNAAFAFASRLSDSFAKYRWSANIIGPQGGGAVEGLPIYNYEAMGEIQTKIPTAHGLMSRTMPASM